MGLRAKPMLLAALANPDAEVVHRARECLRQIDEGTASASTAAAIRVLARQKPDGAAAALLDFLPAAGEEELAEQARLSLADLAVRDGKADPALVRALTDASAMKRGAAAFALCRGRGGGPAAGRAEAAAGSPTCWSATGRAWPWPRHGRGRPFRR